MRQVSVLAVLLATATLTLGPPVAADRCSPMPSDGPSSALARTDQQVTGNRVAQGCGPIGRGVSDVPLDGTPQWLLPDPDDRGSSWFVVLEDGSVDRITVMGDTWSVRRNETPSLPPGEPPLVLANEGEPSLVSSAIAEARWFDDPLPDVRVTEVPGGALVALEGPTHRYAHAALGDDLEASSLSVRDDTGSTVRIEVGGAEVIEGTAAMVVDLDGDGGPPELLVTISDAGQGARLRAYGLDGALVAESTPIGRGFRWMHQVGVGETGPDGETEVIAVRTPHIGGVVEAYQQVGDRLELVASLPGYSSHRLGSSNLDMALLVDADGDGRLDVVVPTQDMTSLGVLARAAAGFTEIDSLPLDGELATNVAATPDGEGALVLAVGTNDGRMRIFR